MSSDMDALGSNSSSSDASLAVKARNEANSNTPRVASSEQSGQASTCVGAALPVAEEIAR